MAKNRLFGQNSRNSQTEALKILGNKTFQKSLVYLKKSCAILIFGIFLKMLNNLTQTCLCATFIHGTISLRLPWSLSDIFVRACKHLKTVSPKLKKISDGTDPTPPKMVICGRGSRASDEKDLGYVSCSSVLWNLFWKNWWWGFVENLILNNF